MRDIIYYSQKARTTGNFGDDLMKELIGRISDKRKIATDLFEVIESIRNS